MKKSVRIGVCFVLFLVISSFAFIDSGLWNKITGNAVSNGDSTIMDFEQSSMAGEDGYGGPSAEDSACLKRCVVDEGKDESVCMTECGVAPQPEPTNEGEGCMQQCIIRGCDDEKDFNCQRANVETCENECGMKGDAPDESDMSEEQKCISNCVAAEDSTIICGSGTFEGEGETGNEICQRCANECVHLYSGPCLTDELWREKEDACMAQGEHMEAALVTGDSGEGYECTVDLECIDRSSEFGDESGTGLGIGQEGYVNQEEKSVVGNIFEGIGNFFKGIFGGGSDNEENSEE